MSYWARTSRTCWSLEAGGLGEDGQGPLLALPALPGGKGEVPVGGQSCCRMSANVWRRAMFGPGGVEIDKG